MDAATAFPSPVNNSSQELFEKQQRELNKYSTRYVYAPFQTVACAQLSTGQVPAGEIFPIPAPKGHINAGLLPDGAQILELVAPAPDAPKSVAVYLHEVEPVVLGLVNVYAREGFIEIKSLFGMGEEAFESNRINSLLFGEPAPTTAKEIDARMAAVVQQAESQKSAAAVILARVAREIQGAVATCSRMCSDHIRERHVQMDDPNYDGPKRYSRRDLRAIEFIGAVRREEYLQHIADQQQQAMRAIPEMVASMREQQAQTAAMFAQMAELLKAQTDVLKQTAGAGNEAKKK